MAITQVFIGTPSNLVQFTDSAMGNLADAVKASSTLLYSAFIDNSLNASPVYVKLFNLAAGSVVVGTTAPDEIIYVPANARISQAYLTVAAAGKTFATALSAICVTTGGTAGSTSPAANVPVTLNYV